MKRAGMPFLITVIFFILKTDSFSANKMIYGSDDRLDYYEMPENLRPIADAIVSIWKKQQVIPDQVNGSYKLLTSNFGELYNLCPDVKFRDQPAGAFCSGTLVGQDLILTAGHCIVTEAKCKDSVFVFDYAVKTTTGTELVKMDQYQVYFCSKIIKRQWTSTTITNDNQPQTIHGPDFALIQLDRKVIGRKPADINRKGDIKKGEPVFVMGHPNGIPLKFTANASVVKEVKKEDAYFVTNLDMFGGNSGSAVFNANTQLIEGILVRGDGPDFIPTFNEGCFIYATRPHNAGFGEAITKIDFIVNEIPLIGEEFVIGDQVKKDFEKFQKIEILLERISDFGF